jgi:hypothetical protein
MQTHFFTSYEENVASKWVVHCKKSKYDVYIGRRSRTDPGEWGNKYIIGVDGTREECIEKHRRDVYANPKLIRKIKRELKGKKLGCFCDPLPCHGDTYAEIANDDVDPNWLEDI